MFDPRTLPIFDQKRLPYTLVSLAFIVIAFIPVLYFYFPAQESKGPQVNAAKTMQSEPTPSIPVSVTPTPKTLSKSKIILWNGTTTTGLTNTAEKALQNKSIDFELVSRGNADEKYDDTVVIDLSGSKKDEAEAIAKAFGGAVGSFPIGETEPKNAEILVILGKSFAE
jgi:phosphopantothenoylcysteine synthetase/decarboxylase